MYQDATCNLAEARHPRPQYCTRQRSTSWFSQQRMVKCDKARRLLVAERNGGEAALSKAWSQRLWGTTMLRTTDGQSLQVVYPGRRRGSTGPDFQEAIVVRGEAGHVEHGDVELHLRSSGWAAHHHAGRAAYAGVILHVVLFDDGGEPPHRADGSTVPTIVLAPYIPPGILGLDSAVAMIGGKTGDDGGPCQISPALTGRALLDVLEEAGLTRCTARASIFEGDLAALPEQEAEQVLFRGLMDAAGYSRNRMPCRALADRLSLRVMQTLCTVRPIADATMLCEAILLGMAGLLGQDDMVRQTLWEEARDLWAAVPLHRTDWQLSAVRPANRPEARLRAMATIVARTAATGLVDALMTPLYQPIPPTKAAQALLAVLVVRQSNAERGAASLGAPRATEMLVNVVLPFALAWAETRSDDAPAATSRAVLAILPGSRINDKLAAMQDVLAPVGCNVEKLTALQQQGVLHLYDRHCAYRDCIGCPLAQGPTALNTQ